VSDLLQLGFLGLLLVVLFGVISWLVRRLNACEERCRQLEDTLSMIRPHEGERWD